LVEGFDPSLRALGRVLLVLLVTASALLTLAIVPIAGAIRKTNGATPTTVWASARFGRLGHETFPSGRPRPAFLASIAASLRSNSDIDPSSWLDFFLEKLRARVVLLFSSLLFSSLLFSKALFDGELTVS
jgi:hypothetical protein